MLSDALAPDGSAMATPPMTTEEKIRSMVEGLRVLSRPAEPAGVTLLLEPLNSLIDHPGCFLDSVALAVEVVGRLNSPRVKVLYDIYHMHVMGKNVLREIENNQEWIGYFHVADSPGRHQPGTGEIDYAAVGELLGRLKYRGFVGMEFAPLGPSAEAVKAPIETFARFTHA
jgi:hydroxypyruvate isomerase